MLEFGLLGPWVGEHDCHSCKINGSLPLWAAKIILLYGVMVTHKFLELVFLVRIHVQQL